ncbi:MAG TPA: efflux RND transporter permease subunit [Acidobacteriaceae bacterium]|nr:efflux RND transporter permease subunit [Acidobacteriaceae bacterium]
MSEVLHREDHSAPAAMPGSTLDFHPSAPFIRRPVATFLLSIAIMLAGAAAYRELPIASLPQVEYPTISVNAELPGADPETVASAIATPLERQFGRIAGINQMTSTSSIGSASIMLQFDLDRDVNGAARDVEAAINAARSQLPANMPGNPTYRKVNPSDPPVLILALTSPTLPVAQMYDAADSIIAQRISQVPGVGEVRITGSAKPAVRVEVNPMQLSSYGLGLNDIAAVLNRANVNRPKGFLSDSDRRWSISATDQLGDASTYAPLIVAWHNGAPVRLRDVATVRDSVEDIYTRGVSGTQTAILMIISKSPGANIIDTVDAINAIMPELRASINPSITISTAIDRTVNIRGSVREVTHTLIISILLVVLVVFCFLREVRSTIIPSVSVPLSLLGAFIIMLLLHETLDNLSLMALTISTGFVVDDAIVVIENINRHMEEGMSPFDAAMLGSREIGFTVLSMSTSLIAVFIPILMMGGLMGKLFREFAIVLSAAIFVSLFASLTTTPMLSAKFLEPHSKRRHGSIYKFSERAFDALLNSYKAGLHWVLAHRKTMLLVTVCTFALSVYLYVIVPKGFFPQQDIGRLQGRVVGQQDASFDSMKVKMQQYADILARDPDADIIVNFLGYGPTGAAANQGQLFMTLKPLAERPRGDTADKIIARLRPQIARVPGATLFLQAQQDLNVGARSSATQFQYTLSSQNLEDLRIWTPRMMARMTKLKEIRDVNTDQQDLGLLEHVSIDRDTASRLGITSSDIDNVLYSAFGQRQVSTIFTAANQYHVVLYVNPEFQRGPADVDRLYVRHGTAGITTANEASAPPQVLAASTSAVSDRASANAPETAASPPIPLSAITHRTERRSSLVVNHQAQFPAATISFNLAPGVSLSQATDAIDAAERDLNLPATIQTGFQGTAQAFEDSLSSEPVLVLLSLTTVYIVLGMLYESFIHPLTILSTLPSAGVGALVALLIFKIELSIIAMIGIILLIGIVKKNAIMMVDFAIVAERDLGMEPERAIYEACVLRFRPIMMTTMAAMLGALPLAIDSGVGYELRRPLGITIVGGLVVSQALTLFTTPVVYLFFDGVRDRLWSAFGGKGHAPQQNRPPHIAESEPAFSHMD